MDLGALWGCIFIFAEKHIFFVRHLLVHAMFSPWYSDAVGYIRKRLRFEILRTTVISLRGDRGARKNIVDINSLDLNLEPQGQG